MAEPIDLFRRALAGAARAIARDPEVEVAFASEAATASGKTARVPSPGPNVQFPFGAVPDGQPDVIECGSVGRSDGDPGDQAFRVLVDGDFANDCATVVNQ